MRHFLAMTPTNIKTVDQTSLFHIERDLDRLGLLSPTHGQRSKQWSGQITLQRVLINKLMSCRNKENCSSVAHGGGGLELVKLVREAASSRRKPCASLKNAPGILPVRRSLLALVGRKQTVVRDSLLPQNPPVRAFDSRYRTRVQHFPGSSTIELFSTLHESGACSPYRACHGTLTRAAAPYQSFRDSATCLSLATTSRRAPN